jgi:hypothetical protein
VNVRLESAARPVNFHDWALEIKLRPVERFREISGKHRPLIRKKRADELGTRLYAHVGAERISLVR